MQVLAPPDGALEIEDRIRSYIERINRETSALLKDIAEFDRREAWRADGATSMEHWLQFAQSVSWRTARDWVETARSLEGLPHIRAALEDGALSWDQTKPLVSFATPDLDSQLAREAAGWTTSALEDEARRRKRVSNDGATVVVHVSSDLGELENGVMLADETVRRLGCDARLQMIFESKDGKPTGVGRTTRVVPHSLMRELRYRDKGCRFPECERDHWLAAHHIEHWSRGGRTDIDNLVLICGYHHMLVHEHGFRIVGNTNGELTFHRPDGTPIIRRSARSP